jgi:hypothetical protein
MIPKALLSLFLLPLAACGMGPFAGEGGGAENLPSCATGPYTLLEADFDTPADEPYVLAQPVVSLLDPAVLEREDAGFDIYYTKVDDNSSEIWRADLPDVRELINGAPEQILVADSDWEQGSVSAPAVVIHGEEIVLYYQGGQDPVGVGLARSTDGGRSFVKDANNPIVTDARDPHVTTLEGRWYMVHVDPQEQRILLRESENGIDFADAREVLATRPGVDTAFDQLALRAPALKLHTTLNGGLLFSLFYSGLGYSNAENPIESIGYLGSFDGIAWERFMTGEPILLPGPTGAGGASPIVGATGSKLFFHQLRQGRGRIALATSSP